jgi:Outer membrane protein beta-barrel domain
MRPVSVCGVPIALALASACMAQEREWEVGAAGGFGFMRNATVNNPTGSVSAGFDNRFAAGVVIGQDLYQHFGGEVRYTFRDNDLVLKGAGQKVNMDGNSHLVHYDLVVYALGKSSRIRPFAAAGGGIRLFGGTGHEYTNQPFGDFALLTKTTQVKPLISVGGGVKVSVTTHTTVRVDFRDYISPFPENLFATAPGAKIRGWLNDFVPLVGVSYVF